MKTSWLVFFPFHVLSRGTECGLPGFFPSVRGAAGPGPGRGGSPVPPLRGERNGLSERKRWESLKTSVGVFSLMAQARRIPLDVHNFCVFSYNYRMIPEILEKQEAC